MRESSQSLEGRVTVWLVDRRGRALREISVPNLIVGSGRRLAGQRLIGAQGATPITHLAVGGDATAPTEADTGLRAEIGTIDRAPLESRALTDAIGLRVSAQVSSAAEAGVSEAGLFTAGEHGAGIMYNRVVFPSPLPISAALDLVFEWDITF